MERTATGRLSSSDPNLQNIPVKKEDGMRIREGFIAKKGYKLLGIDYSQIELRVLTEISKDESLKKAYNTRGFCPKRCHAFSSMYEQL